VVTTEQKTSGFDWNAFSQKTWVVVVSIVFLPLLGLILLWRHPTLGKRRDWWAGAIIWSVLYMAGNFNREETSSGSGSGSIFSAEQKKAIQADINLRIADSLGELEPEEADSFLEMKKGFESDGKQFVGTTSENTFFLLLMKPSQWKKAAKKKGLTREQYFHATNLIFVTTIPGYGLGNRDVHDAKLFEITGEHLSNY